jgi:hypothetical protein
MVEADILISPDLQVSFYLAFIDNFCCDDNSSINWSAAFCSSLSDKAEFRLIVCLEGACGHFNTGREVLKTP